MTISYNCPQQVHGPVV